MSKETGHNTGLFITNPADDILGIYTKLKDAGLNVLFACEGYRTDQFGAVEFRFVIAGRHPQPKVLGLYNPKKAEKIRTRFMGLDGLVRDQQQHWTSVSDLPFEGKWATPPPVPYFQRKNR